MNRKPRAAAIMAGLSAGILVAWSLPILAQSTSQGADNSAQHQHARGPKQLFISNGEMAQAHYWSPDLKIQPVAVDGGQITLPKTGLDNYHALVVKQDWGRYQEVMIRYYYQHGKPSKASPTQLLEAEKAPLEIVPDPLPREHHRYYTREDWPFVVRFRGELLRDQPLLLETRNGSMHEYRTDRNGRIEINLPDDFPDIVEGERDRRKATFTLSTTHDLEEIRYSSSLVQEYHINPSHWRPLSLGVAVTCLGMLAGGVLGRVRPQRREKHS